MDQNTGLDVPNGPGHHLSRRRLFGLSAASAAVWLGFPGSTPARVRVDPVTVMAATNAAISLMRSFSSPGNGLEAMMQAQNAKLNLIITQLGDIQTSLVRLKIDVAQLPTIVTGLLRYQYRDELISNITGAAGRFATLSRARITDPAYIATANARNELSDILNTATQNRSTLSFLPEGRGPEAAGIAALGLGLEVATLGLLGNGRARILAALDDYVAWIKAMRSQDAGSIWTTITDCVTRHDAIIEDLKSSELGRHLPLDNAKMGSAATEIPGRVRDPCHVICSLTISGPNPTYAPTAQIASNLRAFCPVGWGTERELALVPDPVLGVRLLDYRMKWEGVIAPWEGDVCTTQVAAPWSNNLLDDFLDQRLSETAIKNQTSPFHGRFDARRAAFVEAIDKANYYRGRAGQCAAALATLDEVDAQMRLYRSLVS